MSEDSLKPCPNPWCFSDDIDVLDYSHSDSFDDLVEVYYCKCSVCKIESKSSTCYHEAIAAWNTRPIEDALNQRIRALEQWQREAVEYLKKDRGHISNIDKLIKQAEGE